MEASTVIRELKQRSSEEEKAKISRFFKGGSNTEIIGVRMKDTFEIAKAATGMELGEVETLLDSSFYEARTAAVSVLDFKARNEKLTNDERKTLYDVYIDNHDRIDNWDLVDRAAPHVVGRYLIDKSRTPLERLAKSKDVWRRRTSITAPLYFLRFGEPSDIDDVFKVAKILLADSNEFVSKSVGIALKYVTPVDQKALLAFLDEHLDQMQGPTRRYAIEKLSVSQKAKYKR